MRYSYIHCIEHSLCNMRRGFRKYKNAPPACPCRSSRRSKRCQFKETEGSAGLEISRGILHKSELNIKIVNTAVLAYTGARCGNHIPRTELAADSIVQLIVGLD